MREVTIVEAVRETLAYEMARDERVMVLGEDVGKTGGVFRATDGLYEKFGRERVFDTPLAESAIIGSAIGLAVSGMIPVAEIQFMGFTHNAMNQIAEHLARMRYRSWGSMPLPVTIRTPYGGGVRAPEMHSDALEAFFTQCPGLKVVAPATPADTKGLLLAAIRDPDPVMVLEPLRGYRLIKGEMPDGDYTVPIGKARVAREGADCTIIAWSAQVEVAKLAAVEAEKKGVSVEVIDLRSLVPMDMETVRASVAKTGRVVVLQEANKTSGFAAEVMASIHEDEDCFYALKAPMVRVCGPDTPYPVQYFEEEYLVTPDKALRAVLKTVNA
jgi:pyruvate dehydrogenase E1 component beta subunit